MCELCLLCIWDLEKEILLDQSLQLNNDKQGTCKYMRVASHFLFLHDFVFPFPKISAFLLSFPLSPSHHPAYLYLAIPSLAFLLFLCLAACPSENSFLSPVRHNILTFLSFPAPHQRFISPHQTSAIFITNLHSTFLPHKDPKELTSFSSILSSQESCEVRET